MTFLEVFARLELRRPGSTAVDVEQLLELLGGDGRRSTQALRVIARATAGILVGMLAAADPEYSVLGGPWGSHPRLLDALERELPLMGRGQLIRAARVGVEPPLTGARAHALDQLRATIIAARRVPAGT